MRTGGLRLRIAQGLLLMAITAALFLVVEGLSSSLVALRAARQAEAERAPYYYGLAPERRHAQYDEELGWVSIPNLYLPDLYGKGRYLRTDARGFRSDHEVQDDVPEGKLRVVCSGDSFTFGQGVANDRTWCHQLSTVDERLEAVNMGQRGYGVDQAYLWYMRDGRPLDHHIHVFAFIGADFSRMRERSRKGYGKPVLRLRNGELQVANVPVPPVQRREPGVFERVGSVARNLRSVQLAQKLVAKTRSVLEGDTRAVALKVFETLGQVNDEKGSVLILLYLPVQRELSGTESRWRLWLHEVAGDAGFRFIDLTPEMRGVAPEIAETFFIGRSESEDADDAGHYSNDGHEWVAEVLYGRLIGSQSIGSPLSPSLPLSPSR